MSKRDLLKEAQKAGLLSEDANADELTEAQLLVLLGRGPAWEGSKSVAKPIVGPDGHPTLTQEDIDARNS